MEKITSSLYAKSVTFHWTLAWPICSLPGKMVSGLVALASIERKPQSRTEQNPTESLSSAAQQNCCGVLIASGIGSSSCSGIGVTAEMVVAEQSCRWKRTEQLCLRHLLQLPHRLHPPPHLLLSLLPITESIDINIDVYVI